MPWKENPQGLLFPNRKGRPSKRAHVVKFVSRRAGKVRPANSQHWPPCFRHGLGTALANAGASPAAVQRTQRHTDIKTTLLFYGKRSARQPKHDSREALPHVRTGNGGSSYNALEQRTGHLFRNEMHLLAPHFECHGRIVLNTRTDAYDKGLVPHPAHHFFGVASFFLDTAHYGLPIARSGVLFEGHCERTDGNCLGMSVINSTEICSS